MKRTHKYILGDSEREAARLRAQARLWDPVAHALFDRLKVRKGWRVLEIGPGQGSLHMELRRRTRRPVDAVEPSAAFAGRLAGLCRSDGFGLGELWNRALQDAVLPKGRYDLIFARWVFLFLPDAARQVRKLAGALKPGGLLAIEDYHRETMAMIPRPPHWTEFAAADLKFFAEQGGDASVGGRLPGLFKGAGLRLVEIMPNVKTGRPGSRVWEWVSDYFLGVMPRYGRVRPLTPAKAAAVTRAWKAAEREKTSLFISPAVLDVVGRKPR